jgi:hypothetical protein
MSPAYTREQALPILEQAVADRHDERGIGGAAKVAAELGCTESLISQLRGGSYPSPRRWYRLIVEKYGSETVICPVVGQISLERCGRETERPYSLVNPTRRAFSQTCPTCERRH